MHFAESGTRSRGNQTKGPRLPTARELMSDAERILHKNGSGMSLYERLTRDMQLRKDMLELLAELELLAPDIA